MKRLVLVAPLLLAAAVVELASGCSKPKPVVLVEDAAPLNVTPVATASVARKVNPDSLPAYSGPTGSVEGKITVTGDPAPESGIKSFPLCKDGSAEPVYGHAFREGVATAPGGPRPLADAIVAITGYGNFFVPEKNEAHAVTIEGCSFGARTVTMTFGQRLEVSNKSSAFWTPLLQPAVANLQMMAVPGGDPIKLVPRREGFYRLLDRDRTWAESDVYVLYHPLHTVSTLTGTYRIDGIPAGKVKVNTSHPRIPSSEAAQEIEIKPDEVTHADLALVYRTPAKPDAGAVTAPILK